MTAHLQEIKSVEATTTFLEALRSIFDNVLMSQEKYTGPECAMAKELDSSILYFFEWWAELVAYRRGNANAPVSKDVLKCFPSEQTLDNLRITYYGFKGYTEYFFKTFGTDFYLIPQKICTNSPLESFFGCLKHMSGATPLTACNYNTCVANLNWIKLWKLQEKKF